MKIKLVIACLLIIVGLQGGEKKLALSRYDDSSNYTQLSTYNPACKKLCHMTTPCSVRSTDAVSHESVKFAQRLKQDIKAKNILIKEGDVISLYCKQQDGELVTITTLKLPVSVLPYTLGSYMEKVDSCLDKIRSPKNIHLADVWSDKTCPSGAIGDVIADEHNKFNVYLISDNDTPIEFHAEMIQKLVESDVPCIILADKAVLSKPYFFERIGHKSLKDIFEFRREEYVIDEEEEKPAPKTLFTVYRFIGLAAFFGGLFCYWKFVR